MALKRIPVDGKLYCTCKKHWDSAKNFRFYKHYRRSWCRDCENAYDREYQKTKRAKLRAQTEVNKNL